MEIKFRIDKNYPIPPVYKPRYRRKVKKNYAWPFKRMNIGDSFSMPDELRVIAGAAARSHTRRFGAEFVMRKVGRSRCRLWRVS